MVVVILCGGRGSRVRSVIGDVPKHLYPVPSLSSLGYLLDSVSWLDAEIRVVVSPDDRGLFCKFGSERYVIVDQPEPLGEANAVFCAIEDLRFSKVPVLVLLGDQIPIGSSAVTFFSRVLSAETSLLAVEYKSDLCRGTLVQTKTWEAGYVPASSFVCGFVEVVDCVVPGVSLYRAGFDFVLRSDLLYEAIGRVQQSNRLVLGEFCLTSAYQILLNGGMDFDTFEVEYLSVGDKESIEKTIVYFDSLEVQ